MPCVGTGFELARKHSPSYFNTANVDLTLLHF